MKTSSFTSEQFQHLMQRVADGWNEGDAKKAVDCYTEDIVYSEPPEKQLYPGRTALYEFFGGDNKPDPPMKMEWHHLAFNEEEQVGFGEFTFEANKRFHGIVIVRIQQGKISQWREYQYQSPLDWEAFQGKNRF